VDGMFRSIYVRITNQRSNPLYSVKVQSRLSISAIRSIIHPPDLRTSNCSVPKDLCRYTMTFSTQIFNPACPPICKTHSLISSSDLPSFRFPSGVTHCSQTPHSKPPSPARGRNVPLSNMGSGLDHSSVLSSERTRETQSPRVRIVRIALRYRSVKRPVA
jgi:hypothetical protein